jgi:hypothetical protein
MKGHDGFLLMEVMLAMAVLTGAILVVFQSSRTAHRMVQEAQALYQASLRIEERISVREKTGEVNLEPSEDDVLGPVSWSMKVEGERDDVPWNYERYQMTWNGDLHANHLELAIPVAR